VVFAYTPAFITEATLMLRLSGHRLLLRAEATDRALVRDVQPLLPDRFRFRR